MIGDAQRAAEAAIAAWNEGKPQEAEARLLSMAHRFPQTWPDVFVDAKPPREMVRRLLVVSEKDGAATVTIRYRDSA